MNGSRQRIESPPTGRGEHHERPRTDVLTYRRAAAFPLPTLERIEAALDELLAATLKHDRERDEAAIAARAGGASESLSAHGFADAVLRSLRRGSDRALTARGPPECSYDRREIA